MLPPPRGRSGRGPQPAPPQTPLRRAAAATVSVAARASVVPTGKVRRSASCRGENRNFKIIPASKALAARAQAHEAHYLTSSPAPYLHLVARKIKSDDPGPVAAPSAGRRGALIVCFVLRREVCRGERVGRPEVPEGRDDLRRARLCTRCETVQQALQSGVARTKTTAVCVRVCVRRSTSPTECADRVRRSSVETGAGV